MTQDEVDLERRFSGVRRLYGEAGLARLQAAHVCVIGLGGVGSWAAEALARNAVGHLTLIDLDNIAESNVNRQLHALGDAFGQAKVAAMAARIRLINPYCQVRAIEDFVTPENVAQLLENDSDAVFDAIDDARAKVALAVHCRQQNIPLIMAGGAGGRLDPTRIHRNDLAYAAGDRLLAKVRDTLRRDHGFPRGAAKPGKKSPKFGITCLYSDEPVRKPVDAGCEFEPSALSGLHCAGYGSSVCVTAAFGMTAAASILDMLVKAV